MTLVDFKFKCPENWENMRIGLHSRFCENCKKDVIDFTQKSRQEILLYLLANKNKQVCGRLLPDQLDFSYADILITINSLTPKQRNTNLPFYLLTIGSLILSSCNNNSAVDIETTPEQIEVVAIDPLSDSVNKIAVPDTIHSLPEKPKPIDVIPIIGILIVEPDTSYLMDEPTHIPEVDTNQYNNKPLFFAEIMPEFVGGIDSLMYFIKNNIQYPEWEKANNIEGIVYVTFTIDKTGKIKNPKILRSVVGSKNFDDEVFRVISIMPDWKPGEMRNEKVDVQYNLPIRFTL